MAMHCTVWRSENKAYTYLYLRDGVEFDDLPARLVQHFGEPVKVMELELTPEKKLARGDVEAVMKNLEQEGFHLQLPPTEDASGWLELPPPPGSRSD